MKNRHFNLVDMIDVRRRGNGVAQVFSTEEALHEYTVKTARYFPRGSPKAGNLLRRLLQKTDKEGIISLTKSSLVPSRYIHEQGIQAKAKDNIFLSSRRSEKRRMIAETIEAINDYSCVEFDSKWPVTLSTKQLVHPIFTPPNPNPLFLQSPLFDQLQHRAFLRTFRCERKNNEGGGADIAQSDHCYSICV